MGKDGVIESIGIVAAAFLISMFLLIKNPLKLKGTYVALNAIPAMTVIACYFMQSILAGVMTGVVFASIIVFVAAVINKE